MLNEQLSVSGEFLILSGTIENTEELKRVAHVLEEKVCTDYPPGSDYFLVTTEAPGSPRGFDVVSVIVGSYVNIWTSAPTDAEGLGRPTSKVGTSK